MLKVSTPDSIDAIVAAVRDQSEEVRYYAIEAARSFHEAVVRVLPALVESLPTASEEIKYVSVLVMMDLGEDASSAIPALLGLFGTSDPHLRFHAAYALVRIDKGPADALVAKVLQETLVSNNVDEGRLAARLLEQLAERSKGGRRQ